MIENTWVHVPALGSYFAILGGEILQRPANADNTIGDASETCVVDVDALTDADVQTLRDALGFTDEPNADEVR